MSSVDGALCRRSFHARFRFARKVQIELALYKMSTERLTGDNSASCLVPLTVATENIQRRRRALLCDLGRVIN